MKYIYVSKKWLFILWVLLGIFLLTLYMGKNHEEDYKAVFASPITWQVIVIDAGHGGFDSGATSDSGIREDIINLKVAQKLKAYLEQHGSIVIMTRETDKALANRKSLDMQKRVEIIRESNADIVISIHMNKFGQSQYYGAQSFYMTGSEEGKKLAESIQSKLLTNLDRGNKREIKPVNNLMILKASSAPTVIVECGFLSNPEEAALLNQDDYQEKVAWSIYSGIVDYFAIQ